MWYYTEIMMKKLLYVMILGAVVLGVAYSLEFPAPALSGGGGLLFSVEPGGGFTTKNGALGSAAYTTEARQFSLDGGAYGFFDATFAEVFADISFGSLNYTVNGTYGSQSFKDKEAKGSAVILTIGLLGKFPFQLTPKFSLFPLLGAEYQIYLSSDPKMYGYNQIGEDVERTMRYPDGAIISKGDFNATWFRAGGGMDFSITGALYIRAELLYGLRLVSKVETDYSAQWKKWYGGKSETSLGHGGQVKIAVGYRFITF
ncbi:hypothetical protein FACS1894161_0020 [Spirochaetia bacterium]|nr:hypothetical protein FACS1894161_0020 [Spirochaetia bacterium]